MMPSDKAARLEAIRAAKRANEIPAPAPTSLVDQDAPPAVALSTLILLLVSVAAGAILATIVVPQWLPSLTQSIIGTEPKAYWHLSRSSAFVAYGLLWLSMALGISMTSKLARLWPGGPTAYDLHQHTSLLALAFALFHALILLGDQYIAFTISQIIMPFSTSDYRPLEVGLGQIGFYLMLLVGLSFYAKNIIGRRGWRIIHYLSFAMFLLALLHGILSGSDSSSSWAQAIYWISGGSIMFLSIYRIISLITQPATQTRA